MSTIGNQYKKLAIAVLQRAILDTTAEIDGKNVRVKDRERAIKFLDNTPMLGFYADIADVRGEMEKAGYIKKDLIKQTLASADTGI